MKERPILFGGAMVRALLAGTKTQTRRIVKPVPPPVDVVRYRAGDGYSWIRPVSGQRHWCVAGPVWCVREQMGREPHLVCPYGRPGDWLWVRETWCPVNDDGTRWVDYRATPRYSAEHPAGWENAPDDADALKWRSPRFMPRWASRITLEITDVRMQRLQEISEEDARAEGCPGMDLDPRDEGGTIYAWQGRSSAPDPRAHFAALWNTINGARAPWAANPWVWSVSFKRVTP